MARKLSPAQIKAGFGGKAARSGARKRSASGSGKKASGGGSRKKKVFTVHALDWVTAGALLERLNAPAVVARGIAVAQGQAKLPEQVAGAIHDVYTGARQNAVALVAIPVAYTWAKSNIDMRKTVKVPFIPLRVGA